jgi:hypothetical protein
MKRREGEASFLKTASLAVPGLQKGQSSGRLLSGCRRDKDVGNSSKVLA